MELTMPDMAPQKHSVWDNYTPLITTGRHTDVYLADQIEAPSEYSQLCHQLREAFSGDTFTLHINNGGGFVDSGFMILDAIKNTKATVTAKLSGTVASISTIIALSCHALVIAEHTGWLSHNYSGGVQGKGGEMKAQMEFMSKQLATSFRSIHTGFFTDAEMTNIIEDKDFWMDEKEVIARWDARASNDTDALEAIAESRT